MYSNRRPRTSYSLFCWKCYRKVSCYYMAKCMCATVYGNNMCASIYYYIIHNKLVKGKEYSWPGKRIRVPAFMSMLNDQHYYTQCIIYYNKAYYNVVRVYKYYMGTSHYGRQETECFHAIPTCIYTVMVYFEIESLERRPPKRSYFTPSETCNMEI